MSAEERFSIKVYINPGDRQVWRVQGRKFDGQRVRENFNAHAQAKVRKAELAIEAMNQSIGVGLKQTRLNHEQLAQAETAFLRLRGEPLLPAVDFFLKKGLSTAIDITVRVAVQKFLAFMQT
jgi:hypothetical protein